MSLVEYYDPDGVFPLIAPILSSRLPLRNLHWKSSIRPLRSIDSLHVEFVPSVSTKSAQSGGPEKADETIGNGSPEHKKSEGKHGGIDGRRHQIPGLRSTPFLKIYVLRCDDKDVYKASKRRLLRDWVKENSIGPQNSKQENHDACEWLILHVVLPGTEAASQPRFSKRTSADSDQLKERSSSGKWPGRGSRPMLEKLRADFNEQGKSSTDHVAQIRLKKDQLPSDFQVPIPTTSLPPLVETSQEQESAWTDLIAKLKSMILYSFDQRVTQYEEDVREKDSQRQLPGWNFCTFFVLKEGLTLAFESVGLLEDALAAYDELALGLENSIRSMGLPDSNEATTFLEYTPELQRRLLSPASDITTGSLLVKAPASWTYKYRELIASNQISLFDFQGYIFSRQMTLLLQLAGIPQSPSGSAFSDPFKAQNGEAKINNKPRKPEDNPQYLVELGQRAIRFITLAARFMKTDVRCGAASSQDPRIDYAVSEAVMVAAWIYAVAQEILDESLAPSIPKPPSATERQRRRSPGRLDLSSKRRNSSQTSLKTKAKSLSSIRESKGEEPQDAALSLIDVKPLEHQGLADACAQRAELCLLQRRAISRIADSFNFQLKRGAKRRTGHTLDEGDEGSDEEEPNSDHNGQHKQTISLLSGFHENLSRAIANEEDYRRHYEILSERAAWYYLLAGRKKSAEKTIVDLANLKLDQGDYAAAAAHFNRVLPSFGESQWTAAQAAILLHYAQCLKALNRKDEYVRIMLVMLGKSAEDRRASIHPKITRIHGTSQQNGSIDNGQALIGNSLFQDLVEYSRSLPYDISVPLSQYFDGLEIDKHTRILENHDGFELGLSMRQLLASSITIDSIKARLIKKSDGHAGEIWLANEKCEPLGSDASRIWLSASVTTLGRYIVDKVVVQAGKLAFTHDLLAKPEATPSLGLPMPNSPSIAFPSQAPWILCYPRPDALRVKAKSSSHFHLGKSRSLFIEFNSGENELETVDVYLRSATGGLRLLIAEHELVNGNDLTSEFTKSGSLRIGNLSSHVPVTVSIPYTTEDNLFTISIRVEIRYTVGGVDYTCMQASEIRNGLPLEVNVQDIFKAHTLISTFYLKPATSTPLRILNAGLESSDALIIAPGFIDFPTMLSSRERPACVFFKTGCDPNSLSESSHIGGKLLLTVAYRNLEDEVTSQAEAILRADLKASPFAALSELLSDMLATKLRLFLKAADYEAAGLSGEFHVPPVDQLSWGDVWDSLSPKVSGGLRMWLDNWHKEHQTITIPETANHPDSPINHLLIDFDVPHVDYLHTASFHPSTSTLSPTNPTLTAVGEAISGRITIAHTTRWAPPTTTPIALPAHFTYEVNADPTLWLICGPRQATFTAAEDEVSTFDLTLIPLRAGPALLPSIEVRLAWPREGVTCATDCTSRSCAVMVVEGVRSTTVGLGSGRELVGGAMLLEAGVR